MHIRRAILLATFALAAAGILGAFATQAHAFPTYSTQCVSCHSGGGVSVRATQASNNGSTAVYNVAVTGGYAWAAFDGTTKVAYGTTATGQFTATVGKTYTVFGVNGPTTSNGVGQTSVTPVAPAPTDTTAPTTTSNAQATYVGAAAITLTAADNAGGSGVARTYHTLDNVGGVGVQGTAIAVTTIGTHTIEFWSVDVAGNVETPRKTATFTVTPLPPVPDTVAPTTTSNAKASYFGTATITLTATDNAGGSGVAHTYYTVDSVGGVGTEGTAVIVGGLGTHTLEFWSVDASSNVEVPRKVATFSVSDVPPAPVATQVTIAARPTLVSYPRAFALSGLLTPGAVGDRVVVEVRKPGTTRWSYSSARLVYASNGAGGGLWWYRYTPKLRGTYAFRVRFLGDAGRTTCLSTTVYVRVR